MTRDFFSSDFPGIDKVISKVFDVILGHRTNNGTENRKDFSKEPDYINLCNNANIQTIYDYGTYSISGSDVSVFDVVVNDSCQLGLARVGIRKILTKLVDNYSGAFVVFHYENDTNKPWRITWINNSSRQAATSKRYTYLCGVSYPCRTIAKQFEELQKTKKDKVANGQNLTLDDITTAFNAQALSEDFFHEYKIFYDDIIQWITGTRYIKKGNKWERAITKVGNNVIKSQQNFYTPFEQICSQVYIKDWNNFTSTQKTECTEKFIRDFVKKLMGRLVFLQFIQKKHWLGIPQNNADWNTGSESFLMDRFNQCVGSNKNYLKDELYDILFDSLNKSNGTDSSGIKVTNRGGIKYPFLNGGLFEEEEADKLVKNAIVCIPNMFFHNENAGKARVLPNNRQFRESESEFFEYCGLLDFFSHYNFTIDENETDDEMGEVGIDPEMLSKVFENLLEDNKEKGAFYTPKEIVNYMCKESLIAYLTTNIKVLDSDIRAFVDKYEVLENIKCHKETILKALCDVKICDPAVGSGAFPMGLLNLILKLRLLLNDDSVTSVKGYDYLSLINAIKENQEDTEDYLTAKSELSRIKCAIKKDIIQNNIYGVDIEKGAVDLARLRFWLNIVVDEEMPTPLPNLDYKIMQGNSLIEQYAGIDLSNLSSKRLRKNCDVQCDLFGNIEGMDENAIYVTEEDEKFDLQDILKKYFDVSDPDEKRLFRKQISDYLKCIIRNTIYVKKVVLDQEFAKYDTHANLTRRQETSKRRLQESIDKLQNYIDDLQDIINNKFFLWHTWFADVFVHGGFDIVIGNPPYINANERAKIIPQYIQDIYKSSYKCASGNYDMYVLFFELGFTLLKEKATLTFITPPKYLAAEYAKELRKLVTNNYSLELLSDYSNLKVFSTAGVSALISSISNRKQAKNISVSINYTFNSKCSFIYPGAYLTRYADNNFGPSLCETYQIFDKIYSNSILVETVASVNACSTANEADYWEKNLIDNSNPNSKTAFKYINNGTIGQGVNYWGSRSIRRGNLLYPCLPINLLKQTRINQFCGKKIIFKKIDKSPVAFYDRDGVFASANTNMIYDIKTTTYNYDFLERYFNSVLFNYLYKALFGSLNMLGSIQVQAPQLRKSIIPNFSQIIQDAFCENEDYSKIIEMLYLSFNLSTEEIEAINNNSNSDNKIDCLSNPGEKVKIIYHPRWDSFGGERHQWPLQMEYNPATDEFRYSGWNLSDSEISEYKAFVQDTNNISRFFNDPRVKSIEGVKLATHQAGPCSIEMWWGEKYKSITIGSLVSVPYDAPFLNGGKKWMC